MTGERAGSQAQGLIQLPQPGLLPHGGRADAHLPCDGAGEGALGKNEEI